MAGGSFLLTFPSVPLRSNSSSTKSKSNGQILYLQPDKPLQLHFDTVLGGELCVLCYYGYQILNIWPSMTLHGIMAFVWMGD